MKQVNYLSVPSKRHLIGKVLFGISLIFVMGTGVWHREARETLEAARWKAVPTPVVARKSTPKEEREKQQTKMVFQQLTTSWETIFDGLETVLPEDFELKGMSADYAGRSVKLDVAKTELPRAPLVAGELAKQPWVENAILVRHAEREDGDDEQDVEATVDIRWRENK